MKKICVRILILLITLLVISTTVVNGGVDIPATVVTGMSQANTGTGMNGTQTFKVINNVIGLIQIVGSGVALIVIAIMGIKYMLAAPSEKADVKKMVMPVIIGCVLLFGAVNLAGVIENFATDVW